MKISLNDILKSRTALVILNNTKFKSAVAYKIMKNLKTIAEEEKLYEKQRIKICKEFSNKDNEGNIVIVDGKYDIPEERKSEYLAEIEELKNVVVDIPITKITLEEIEGAMLSPAQLDSVEYMLET